MNKVNKKRAFIKCAMIGVGAALGIIALRNQISTQLYQEELKLTIGELRNDLDVAQNDIYILNSDLKLIQTDNLRMSLDSVHSSTYKDSKQTPVLFTNYGTWDGESGSITASGIRLDELIENEQGYLTYNGMLAVATATDALIDHGWYLNNGYSTFNMFDELTLVIDGTHHQAVVIDACGECMGNDFESLQRIDVFTTGNVIGKVEGRVYE